MGNGRDPRLLTVRICLRDLTNARWHAGSIYIRNLANAIASLPPEELADVSISIEMSNPTAEAMESLLDDATVVFTPSKLGRLFRGWAKKSTLPLPELFRNPRHFSFIYPEQAGPRAGYRWGAWVPDFQHVHLPEMFSEQERTKRRADIGRMAKDAPFVVLSSRVALEDYNREYPASGARPVVLHFASQFSEDVFQTDSRPTIARYDIQEPFLLVCNQFWAHKGYETVVQTLAHLLNGGVEPPLVIATGSTDDYRNPTYFSDLTAMTRRLGVDARFRVLGHIPREDQVQLMRASVALVQPSRFEGWSTVVEDARALGKTILLSDLPVHREQDPPGARYFPPQDVSALADLIGEAKGLPSGPDIERERIARRESAALILAFGQAFLDLARA